MFSKNYLEFLVDSNENISKFVSLYKNTADILKAFSFIPSN